LIVMFIAPANTPALVAALRGEPLPAIQHSASHEVPRGIPRAAAAYRAEQARLQAEALAMPPWPTLESNPPEAAEPPQSADRPAADPQVAVAAPATSAAPQSNPAE